MSILIDYLKIKSIGFIIKVFFLALLLDLVVASFRLAAGLSTGLTFF